MIRQLKSALFVNIELKGFAIMVALLLFYFVNSESNMSEVQFIASVEVQNVPEGKMIIWPSTRQTQVTLKGPSFDVSRIASSPPKFKVKVETSGENRYVAVLEKADLDLPPYVRVVSIEPNEMELILDNKIKKQLEVFVPEIGVLGSDLKIENRRLIPDRIEIVGPETEIGDLQRLETVPLDLRDVKGDFVQELNLRPYGNLQELSADKVRVELKVSVIQGEREIKDVPIEIRSISSQIYKLQPTQVNLKLSGPRELIKALKKEEILAFIRVPMGAKYGDKIKIVVELPKSISVLSIDPETVELVRSVAIIPKSVKTSSATSSKL